ncbi:MAG: protein kinase domain-containing protein [Cumulibacter sp.]
MSATDRTDLWLPTAVTSDEYVGPYRLIRKAGSGGMGVVYLAVDKDERPVAVKVLRDHVADDADARARLRRELMTMRRVRDRYIADVVDADLEAERPYIVSEFVDGPQLDDYIAEVGPLGRDGLITLGRGLLNALDAIHAVGVVHRDLKPGNVLLEGHRPVVIDFGIAQLADETRLTMTGLFVGTPGYVSPETISGDPATSATDWWSWAAVLAYAATGSSPAGKGPVEVVLDRIRRGELRLDTVDADLRPLLSDCLAISPSERPRSADIRARFETYASGGSTGPARVRSSPVATPAPIDADPVISAPHPPEDDSSHRQTAVLNAPAAPHSDASTPDRPPAIRRPSEPHDPVAVTTPDDEQPRNPRRRNARAQARDAAAMRPRRSPGLATFCFGALLTAAAMSMPVATGILLLLLLTAARTVDEFVERVRWREEMGSSHRRASVLQAFSTPWGALKALVVSLGSLILPTAIGAGVAYVSGLLIPDILAVGSHVGNISTGLGAIAALTMVWFGPGSRATKASVYRCLRAVVTTQQSVLALTSVLIVATAAIAVVVYRYSVLDWFPLPIDPTRGGW